MRSVSYILNKQHALIAAALLVIATMTILIDFWEARWQQSSFYLSESALFSTYWLLFIPGFLTQRKTASNPSWQIIPLITFSLSVLHLLVYPALIWLLSFSFYSNVFRYSQTLNFAVTEYSLQTVFIYGLPLLVKRIYGNVKETTKPDVPEPEYLKALLLRDGYNRKLSLPVQDLLYISANPPYVNLHLTGKKYLYPGTLKSMAIRLPPDQFLRVHKSYLVNLKSVVSYQSRSNGDYDLILTDGTELRLSRNFAHHFKSAYPKFHQVNSK